MDDKAICNNAHVQQIKHDDLSAVGCDNPQLAVIIHFFHFFGCVSVTDLEHLGNTWFTLFKHFDVIARYAPKDRMILFILYAHVSHSIVSVSDLSFCGLLVVGLNVYILFVPQI